MARYRRRRTSNHFFHWLSKIINYSSRKRSDTKRDYIKPRSNRKVYPSASRQKGKFQKNAPRLTYSDLQQEINSTLSWGQWKQKWDPLLQGHIKYRSAYPTQKFWQIWKRSKSNVRNLGIHVYKQGNRWFVTHWPHEAVNYQNPNRTIQISPPNPPNPHLEVSPFIEQLDKEFKQWDYSAKSKIGSANQPSPQHPQKQKKILKIRGMTAESILSNTSNKETVPSIKSEGNKNRVKEYSVAKIRMDYPKTYARWTNEEDQLLKEKYTEGRSISELSQILQRQKVGIRARLKKQGFLP